jgi:hypothetical protein
MMKAFGCQVKPFRSQMMATEAQVARALVDFPKVGQQQVRGLSD